MNGVPNIVPEPAPMPVEADGVTGKIIGAAIAVHRALGPGLLESAYEQCLCLELGARGLTYKSQVNMPLVYRNVRIENAYRIDLLVENEVIVEVKAVEKFIAVHDAQLLTYLRLAQLKKGLLLNFNQPVLKDGIRRLVR